MGFVGTLVKLSRSGLLVAVCALLAPTGAQAALAPLKQIATTAATGGVLGAAFVRTSDGSVHLVYETKSVWGGGFDGVGSLSITPSGTISPTVEALTGWTVDTPGLFESSSGSLEAVFGGGPDSGGTGYSGPWGSPRRTQARRGRRPPTSGATRRSPSAAP